MTNDPNRLADDIDEISRSIPSVTPGFSQLRQLLGLLGNPLGPLLPGNIPGQLGDPSQAVAGGDVQSAPGGADTGVAAPSGMGAPVATVLSGSGPGTQPSWDQALASQSSLDAFGNPTTTPLGISPPQQRSLFNGLVNGDFAVPARDPGSAITAANPLPGWTVVSVAPTVAAAAYTLATADVPGLNHIASGRVAELVMAENGLASDEIYLEQIVPIGASTMEDGRTVPFTGDRYAERYSFAVIAQVNWLEPVGNLFNGYLEAQFLDNAGVPVGTRGFYVFVSTWPPQLSSWHPIVVFPRDLTGTAYSLRIRIGLQRGIGAITLSESFSIRDVKLRVSVEDWLRPLAISVTYNGDGTVAQVVSQDPLLAGVDTTEIRQTDVTYVGAEITSIVTTGMGKTATTTPAYSGGQIVSLDRLIT